MKNFRLSTSLRKTCLRVSTIYLPVVLFFLIALPVALLSSSGKQVADVKKGEAGRNGVFQCCAGAPQADLSITGTDLADPLMVGSEISYHLVVTNNGPDDATGVVVTDKLPPGSTFVSATPSTGSCTPASGKVTCNIGTITNGATATVDVVVKSGGSPGTIVATATVMATETDPDANNNQKSESTRLVGFRHFSFTPPIVVGGCQNSVGQLLFTSPAPAGVVIDFTDNPEAVAPIPSVTTAGGETSIQVTAETSMVNNEPVITNITANTTSGPNMIAARLKLEPVKVVSLTFNPNPVEGGQTVTATVTLSCPVQQPTVVRLSSDKQAARPDVSQIVIPAGEVSAHFTITTRPTNTQVIATITATGPGGSYLRATLTITPGHTTTPDPFAIRLKSREFTPPPGLDPAFPAVAPSPRHGIIQFYRIPSHQERSSLRQAGVELFTYIPNRAFLARLPADVGPVLNLEFVRYVGPLLPDDKVDPRILTQGVNPYAHNLDGTIRLSVLFFDDVTLQAAITLVRAHGGRITESIGRFHLIRANVPENQLDPLRNEDKVQWVEDIFENKISNDGARAAMGVDLLQAAPYGLDGTGLILGEWDGGHAINTANVIFHQDLAGRVTRGDTTNAAYDYHATHVAGTAIGSGLLSASQGGSPFQWKGMAPNATLIAYDWNSFLSEYSGAISAYHIDLSTNSWHNGGNGVYTSDSRALDQVITGSLGKRIIIDWAAANNRNGPNHTCDIDLDGNTATRNDAFDCIANLASAKNTTTVGATNSNDDSMTGFSSWGPTNDGRLKPDIVAPGCQVGGDGAIKSTVPTDSYTNYCGTSMATPAVAGSTALLLQRFRQLCPSNGVPLPSTIKALLIHGARDLDDGTAWYNRGPDFASGYGRLDLPRSVDLVPFHVEDTVAQLGVKSYQIVVTQQKNLKVTLVWDDSAAAPNASPALVNDLDLELVDPLNGVHQPWVLNPNPPYATNLPLPATRGVDTLNVVEQVVVDNVSLALTGTWTIRVKGTNVPSLTQKFSLVSELLPTTSCTGPATASDLWGADTSSDDGTEPNPDAVPMWISDDIRVRNSPVDGPHQNPEFGQTNYVYITVRNSGTQPGPYARVFLYWAMASTGLSWPFDWHQLGTVTAVNVPAHGSTVVGPIPWNPVASGHYCLYARMITHNEPLAPESADINANTMQSDQIIWKNTNVVDVLSNPPDKSFIFRNASFNAAAFNLRFQEPPGQLRDPFLNRGQVFIDLGQPLYQRWRHSGGELSGLEPVGGTRFRVTDSRRAALFGISMNAREQFTVRMSFSASNLPSGASYRFDVTQQTATGGTTVGGVSFRLQARTQTRP